jgi:ATP-binding cassette subfamily B protein IrtA
VIVFLLLRAPSYSAFVPTALLFFIFGGGMFFPLLKLMNIGGLLKQNSIGVGLIDDILHKQEIAEPEVPRQPAGSSVEFRDVTFAYNEETVLKGISFLAEPGSITALVGPSGAGKSTVGMLAAHFWDANSGEILIGGVPIRHIGTEDLMRHMAFVFQDNMLFFDTIEENIRMGNDTASREEVMEAAGAAQCHEFIDKLEKGYETLVGEGGTYLSGGEQQRIALARAILKNAPIVVLDEATAFADPENEGKILASLSHLINGKTVLIIAHRLSTITGADRILVIDRGAIVEQGKHEELLSLEGLYAKMWRTYTQSRRWVLRSRPSAESDASPPPDRAPSRALPGQVDASADGVFPEASPAG